MGSDWNGIPRREIQWYPAVDNDKCEGCQICYEFCAHGVYEWNEQTNHPVVAQPYECVVGCRNCAAQCPAEALVFPPLSMLVELKKQRGA